MLNTLKARAGGLSKAENRIAQTILADPEAVLTIATGELARRSSVSDPMISRFCRSLGCPSFPTFKVELAKSLAAKTSFISEAVSAEDDVGSYIEKRINANQAALEYLRGVIDRNIISQAVEALASSDRIELFGMGGSAAIARDAQHKLFRMGIPTLVYEDMLMQRMAAAAAGPKTTVLLFSFTGRTQAMIEIAQIVNASGAKLIAITSPDSPLAQLADICINSGNELEDTTIYVPMTIRIVILTIIDILATGLALAQGPKIEQTLLRIKHSLEDTRVE